MIRWRHAMHTKQPRHDWRDGREGLWRRAWELKHQGWKQQDIAATLAACNQAICV